MCFEVAGKLTGIEQMIVKAGALEADLPVQYRKYLDLLPLYNPSEQWRTRIGAGIFLVVWRPIMSVMEKFIKLTLQSDGRAPIFVAWLVRLVVGIMWFSHDFIFAPIFGRGDGLDDVHVARHNHYPEKSECYYRLSPDC